MLKATFPFCACLFTNHTQMMSSMKFWVLFILIGLGLISAGCSVSYILPFNVLVEKAPFLVVSSEYQSLPGLIIIASQDEMIPPAPDFQYSEIMTETLKDVDFNKSFAIFPLLDKYPTMEK